MKIIRHFIIPRLPIFHHVPKERMTLKYLYHRAYIHGISDSFTQVRKDHGRVIKSSRSQDDVMETRKNHASYINMVKIYRILRWGASSITNRAVRYKKKLFPTEYDRIRADMQKSFEAGFGYHQEEAKRPKASGVGVAGELFGGEWETAVRTEGRGQKSEIRCQRAEVGDQGGQMSEVGSQTIGGQRTELWMVG